MATDLRLLIDEAVQNDIADEIAAIPALNCKYVRELSDLKSKSDDEVMAYARRDRRIVLTTEGKFDDKSFKICTHPGIIVIATRSTYRAAPALRKFLRSGHRKEAENAVTFITRETAKVKKHGQVVTQYGLR